MTEKLKYKVGDKVLIEAEVVDVERITPTTLPYKIKLIQDIPTQSQWVSKKCITDIFNFPPKPKVTKAVVDWYESHKRSHWDIRSYFVHTTEDIDRWLEEDLQNGYAFVTLITYGLEAVEVEKEKRYRVKVKGVDQYLRRVAFSNKFEFHEAFPDDLTKQELIAAGFEGVFDNPMFEVEEVEK